MAQIDKIAVIAAKESFFCQLILYPLQSACGGQIAVLCVVNQAVILHLNIQYICAA